MDLKRDEIKYVRDISKSAYKKEPICYICSTENELQFHHFYSLTLLWNKWKKDNKITINTVDDILKAREVFKETFIDEIYNQTVTLCLSCHIGRLHKVYGKVPELGTAMKQKRWCEIQKVKHQDKFNII